MDKFKKIKSNAIPLPMVNIDTDMIIPKQFLKTIKRTGLGKSLFYELRYDENDNKDVQYYISDKDPQNRVWKTYENLNPKGKKVIILIVVY